MKNTLHNIYNGEEERTLAGDRRMKEPDCKANRSCTPVQLKWIYRGELFDDADDNRTFSPTIGRLSTVRRMEAADPS